ncbi:MAG: VCBS repeat-containing protein [Acidobacteria bacterium]|nr:MAG: VCBS repeat-containing protein [Acidobacteriota bacterium]
MTEPAQSSPIAIEAKRSSPAATSLWDLAVAGAALALLAAPAWGRAAVSQAAAEEQPTLREVPGAAGIDFVHDAGATGQLLLPEITGSGLALLDVDGDDDLDVYLVQGGQLLDEGGAALLPAERRTASDRLYRNDSRGGELRFVDVTETAGPLSRGYGMGVASGDFDNDGRVDLYVTNLGPNRLLRNVGGRFEDVTEAAGVGDDGWGVSAAFVDLDRDGWLDLYVGNYGEWSASEPVRCYAKSSRLDYCGPLAYQPEPDVFYRNRGDGSFESRYQTELRSAPGAALGVVASDLDGDGFQEILVANDGTANHLWKLLRGGTGLEEIGLFAGVAVNRSGRPEASMGIDLADYDGDGHEDVFLTHLDGETNTMLRGDGGGSFSDTTPTSGIGPDGYRWTGFGTGSLDADGDGDLDLLVVNGAVRLDPSTGKGGVEGMGQPNRLYLARGDGTFEPTDAVDPVLSLREVSRGLALGDLDGDGDLDVVYSNNDGPVRLLRSSVDPELWWGVDLRIAGRPALGARLGFVHAVPGGERVVWRRAHSDGSYASAGDPRVAVSAAMLAGSVPRALLLRLPGAAERRLEGARLTAGAYVRIDFEGLGTNADVPVADAPPR